MRDVPVLLGPNYNSVGVERREGSRLVLLRVGPGDVVDASARVFDVVGADR